MTQNPGPITITVSHLKKTYGNVKAVEDVSFAVNEGEIFGLPILLLVILGLIPGTREPSSDLGGLSYFALLYPILVAVTILSQSINMLPLGMIAIQFIDRVPINTQPAREADLAFGLESSQVCSSVI
jgi:hypothetical protein